MFLTATGLVSAQTAPMLGLNLFAGVNILSGAVMGDCVPDDRCQGSLYSLGRIERATLLRRPAHLILNKLCHPHPHKGGGLGYGASPILWVPTPTERAPGFSRGLELSEMPPASRVPRTEDGEGEWKGTQEVSGDWCVVGREGSAEE